MTGMEGLLPWTAAVIVLLGAILLLRRPLGKLVGLVLRSCGALAVLAVLQQIGGIAGVVLGVNLVNAVILGALGIPGFGLLLMLQWALR